MEAVCVKSEPEWEGDDACVVSEATARLEGGWLVHHEVKVEHDWENESRSCGVSEAAAKVGLYKDHEVKDEVLLGPELLQPPDMVFALQASLKQAKKETCAQETLRGRPCSVSLERMFVDTDHLTCRVGFQTYKLRLCPQSHLPLVQNENESNAMKTTSRRQTRYQGRKIRKKTNKSQLSVKASLKKGKTETAEERVASVSSQNNSKTDAAGDKPYKCTHCSHVSAYRHQIRRHEMIHTGEKPYKCAYCSYASARKAYVLIHERKHTGETPYKCAYCSYASARKAALLFHEMIHTGDKPHKCAYCSYASIRKADIPRHERIHSGEKPFKCGCCNFSTAHRKSLHRHEITHTGAYKKKLRLHERVHTAEPHRKKNDQTLALLRPRSTAQTSDAREQPALRDCVVGLERGVGQEAPLSTDTCRGTAGRVARLASHADHSSDEAEESDTNITTENTEKETYLCDICKKRFSLKTQLLEHVMVHIHQSPGQEVSWCGVADSDTGRAAPHADHTYARRGPAPAPRGDASDEEIDVESLTPHLPLASSERVRTDSPPRAPPAQRTMSLRLAARRRPLRSDSDSEEEIKRNTIHNHRERIRRFGLKNLFEKLRKQIPAIKNKYPSPKIVIIREADLLCRSLRKKELERNYLRKRNSKLVAKLKTLRTLAAARLPPY